jgi:IS66 Orf2 like protein
VIGPTGAVRVMVATKAVDFRKGAEGLAALVREVMQADPFDGAIYVFRAKRADRVKLVFWDGTRVPVRSAALSAARRPRLAARARGEGHASAEAAGLTCDIVNQGEQYRRKAPRIIVS